MERGRRTYRILLADSHILFRRGLSTLMSAEPDLEIIGEASSAAEAMAKASMMNPDILIMDVALVHDGGTDQAVGIRQIRPPVPVLFLTDADAPAALKAAVEAGAQGYMLKNTQPPQLIAGVRKVLWSADTDTQSLSRTVPDLKALAQSHPAAPRPSALTTREQEILRLLAEGRTVRETALDLSLSPKTVEAHKLNLMRKLDIHNRASLINYAVKSGFVESGGAR